MQGSTGSSYIIYHQDVLAAQHPGIRHAEYTLSILPALRAAFMGLRIGVGHTLDAMGAHGDACSLAHTFRYIVALVVTALTAFLLG